MPVYALRGWYSAYIKVVFWWTSKRKTTWNIYEIRNTIITIDVSWRVQRQKVERVTWGQQRSPDKSTSGHRYTSGMYLWSGQAIPHGNTTLCPHLVDTCLSTNSDILYQKAVQKELLRSDQLHASRRHGWASKTASWLCLASYRSRYDGMPTAVTVSQGTPSSSTSYNNVFSRLRAPGSILIPLYTTQHSTVHVRDMGRKLVPWLLMWPQTGVVGDLNECMGFTQHSVFSFSHNR